MRENTLLTLKNYIVVLCCIFVGIGCNTKEQESEAAAEVLPAQHQAAAAFLETFIDASNGSRKALSDALKPTKEDIVAVFIDTAVQNRVEIYIEKVFEKEQFSITLRPEHKQLLLWTASIGDFQNNTGNALAFPSAFLRVIPYLKEDLTFHRFKFVKPSYPAGAAYEGLTYVNGRWVIFPKVWEAFDW